MDIRLLSQLNIHFFINSIILVIINFLSFFAKVVPQFEHNKTPLL